MLVRVALPAVCQKAFQTSRQPALIREDCGAQENWRATFLRGSNSKTLRTSYPAQAQVPVLISLWRMWVRYVVIM